MVVYASDKCLLLNLFSGIYQIILYRIYSRNFTDFKKMKNNIGHFVFYKMNMHSLPRSYYVHVSKEEVKKINL